MVRWQAMEPITGIQNQQHNPHNGVLLLAKNQKNKPRGQYNRLASLFLSTALLKRAIILPERRQVQMVLLQSGWACHEKS